MAGPRLDLMIHPDAPIDELVRRWQTAEELRFARAYATDHARDYRGAGGPWLDAWSVLAIVARETDSIRIGTLVSNPILRPPFLLALEARTVDLISDGRLELGIGMGTAEFDHRATGSAPWSPGERAERFAEYVEVVDGLLSSPTGEARFEGRHHRTSGAAASPRPVQTPRPPIVVAGQSPTVRRVAAERGDAWNTHGRQGDPREATLERTAAHNEAMDAACRANGRDPSEVRRSLLLFGDLSVWHANASLERVVEDFGAVGISEFVLEWPPPEREGELAELVELA